MSNFTPLVRKEYEFEGDKVSVAFSRLRRKDVLILMPKINSMSKAKSKKDSEKQVEIQTEVLNDLLGFLPDYVKEFEGLKFASGEPIPLDSVIDEMYFMSLLTDIGMDVLNESIISDDPKGKNS